MDTAEFHPGGYLTFRLAGREFAIEAARVLGIVPMHDVEPAEPAQGDPPWLMGRGVIRRRAFQVLDLARWLGLARRAKRRDAYIVVIDGPRTFGFPVDALSDVIQARRRDYTRGKLRIGRPRRVLDADCLFLKSSP